MDFASGQRMAVEVHVFDLKAGRMVYRTLAVENRDARDASRPGAARARGCGARPAGAEAGAGRLAFSFIITPAQCNVSLDIRKNHDQSPLRRLQTPSDILTGARSAG